MITRKLTDKENEALDLNICPNCGNKGLNPVTKSGKTAVCPKCNEAFIKQKK